VVDDIVALAAVHSLPVPLRRRVCLHETGRRSSSTINSKGIGRSGRIACRKRHVSAAPCCNLNCEGGRLSRCQGGRSKPLSYTEAGRNRDGGTQDQILTAEVGNRKRLCAGRTGRACVEIIGSLSIRKRNNTITDFSRR